MFDVDSTKKGREAGVWVPQLNSFVSLYLGDFKVPVHPRGCRILDLYKWTFLFFHWKTRSAFLWSHSMKWDNEKMSHKKLQIDVLFHCWIEVTTYFFFLTSDLNGTEIGWTCGYTSTDLCFVFLRSIHLNDFEIGIWEACSLLFFLIQRKMRLISCY